MLVAESVSKKVGNRYILKDLSLKCDSGIYCIFGKNGAGKSTLLRILAGISMPDSGNVYVDGLNLFTKGAAPRKQIGYLPETPDLYSFLSVQEFLGFVASVKRVSSQAYLDILQRLNMFDRLDHRIETLSQGMKRKVTLVACLMDLPRHLILDEPINAMDNQTIHFLKEVLQSYHAGGKVVILSTHQEKFATELADSFYVLEDGSLRELFHSTLAGSQPSGIERLQVFKR